MKLDIKHDCIGVDWKAIADTLKSVGMAHHEPERHQRAFEASHTTVFINFSNQGLSSCEQKKKKCWPGICMMRLIRF